MILKSKEQLDREIVQSVYRHYIRIYLNIDDRFEYALILLDRLTRFTTDETRDY